jgi:hypothetical protein
MIVSGKSDHSEVVSIDQFELLQVNPSLDR